MPDLNNLVPKVFIDRITLETSTIYNNSNPSTVNGEITVTSPYGTTSRQGISNRLTKNNSSLPLLVTTNFVIKQSMEVDELSPWFEQESNQSFTKYFKLRLITSTDEEITNKLIESSNLLDFRSQSVDFSFKDIELSSYFSNKSLLEQYVTELPNGQREYDIPVVSKVSLRDANPRHLTLFSLCYLDMATLSKDYGMDVDTSTPTINGKVNAEIIIRDYDLVSESYLFLDEFGVVWDGIVTKKVEETQIKNGDTVVDTLTTTKWIAGDGSDTTNVKYLTLNMIPQSKIQDFRVVEELNKNVLDFSVLNNEINNKIPNVSPDSFNVALSIAPKRAYFSNLMLTGDKLGKARYLFGINILDLAKENTLFGKLFKDKNLELLNYIKITSMKVKRVRVSPNKDDVKNEFGVAVFDTNEPYDLVGLSSEKEPNKLPVSKITKGTLREVDLDVESGMRFFTGVDHDMEKVTFGLYQYGVEIEFEDMTLNFLKDRIAILSNAYDGLKDYNNDGLQKDMFDVGVARFVPAFITKQESYYKNKPEASPWSRAVSAYLGVLDLLVDNLDVEKYSKVLLTFVHPRTGTLDGVLTLLKLIEGLLLKLGVITDVSSTTSSRGKIKASGTVPESTIKTRSDMAVNSRKLTIEKYFDSVFDSDLPKQTGYDYLSSTDVQREPNDDGLLVVSSVNFNKRTDEETMKYFKDTTTDINLKTSFKQYTTDDTILNSKFRFLTPSIVELKGQDKIVTNNKGVGLLESKQYEAFTAQVMNFNFMKKSPRIPIRLSAPSATSKLTSEDQITKSSVMNVAFAAGITLNTITPTVTMNVLKASSVVGDNSNFLSENSVKEQPISMGTKTNPEPNAAVNPNSLLLSLIMPEVITGVQTMSVKEVKKDTTSINNFNLSKANNKIDKISRLDIKALPNQLKSLMVSSINSEATKNNFNSLATDIVKDPKKSLGYKMNYNMINEVEVFTGFARVQDGEEKIIKSPIWAKLTPEKFAEATKKNLLCRMKRYENKDLGVKIQNGIELPTYNEYFILSPEEHLNFTASIAKSPNSKIFDIQSKVLKIQENTFSGLATSIKPANSLVPMSEVKRAAPTEVVVQKEASKPSVQLKTAVGSITKLLGKI